MLQSKLFPKTLKEAPKDEVSANAKLLVRAGYINKLMAGVYTYLPLGLRVLKKIENIIREQMLKAGGQELLMPALQPKENWSQTSRWDSYDSLFKFLSYYTKTEFAIGPTHEEIISPLVAKFSLSYKNLPLYLFQIQTKFRDEKRAKSGILRAREFIMKDLYSFHTNEKDLMKYYEKMKSHYKNIFNKLEIDKQTYITFASGGTFSKYSHEFQTVTDAGEDIIYICEKCRVAVNKEIINEQKVCPECKNYNLIEKKAIEIANIFPLKTKYSEPFNLKFTDKDGKQKNVVMGCYGIGLGRLMGAVVEVHHDEKGIIWPKKAAPFDLHLIQINAGSSKIQKKIAKTAGNIYRDLQKASIDVLFDERELSAGEKFADADLIGIPYRIIVSERNLKENKVEMVTRKDLKAKIIGINKIIKEIK